MTSVQILTAGEAQPAVSEVKQQPSGIRLLRQTGLEAADEERSQEHESKSHRLPHEERMNVRPMDFAMTERAISEARAPQIVQGNRLTGQDAARHGVAFQAQLVDLSSFEKARVR
jgi:hypothetical protein